jgi:transcriptional regulator with XRE-family HTH domain
MAKKMAKKQESPRHFLREWRKHRELTQEALADRVGVSREYVSMIEKGKRKYDQPYLEAAAAAMNCTPADLIMRNPTDPEALWSIWDQIPPTERGTARAVLNALIKKAS